MDRMWTRLRTWRRQRATSPADQSAQMNDEDAQAVISVLLVCMGNICRSPMAEGILRQRLAARPALRVVHVDSAGTHGYHVGAAPDRRAQAAAGRRGVDISGLRARQVAAGDFESFDYILAMDRDNLELLLEQADDAHHAKIRLFAEFSRQNPGAEVPDPYYGGTTGFERVLDLVEEVSEGLLEELDQALSGGREVRDR